MSDIKEKLNGVICQSSSDYEELNEVYNYIEKIEKENKRLEKRVNTLKDTQLKQLSIIQQRDEVIDEISKILNKHRFEEEDDYYDCSEQGICITGWDDDYDRLNELLQKYKGDKK